MAAGVQNRNMFRRLVLAWACTMWPKLYELVALNATFSENYCCSIVKKRQNCLKLATICVQL